MALPSTIVISFNPKDPLLRELIRSAHRTKMLKTLLIRSLKMYLATEEGARMKESIMAMAEIKSGMEEGS